MWLGDFYMVRSDRASMLEAKERPLQEKVFSVLGFSKEEAGIALPSRCMLFWCLTPGIGAVWLSDGCLRIRSCPHPVCHFYNH